MSDQPTLPDVIDYLERVAIFEHVDGLSREDAEHAAALAFGYGNAELLRRDYFIAMGRKFLHLRHTNADGSPRASNRHEQRGTPC